MASHSEFYVQNLSSWVIVQDALYWSDLMIPERLICHKRITGVENWFSMDQNHKFTFKWSAINPEDKVWSIFLCILVFINRGSYEITIRDLLFLFQNRIFWNFWRLVSLEAVVKENYCATWLSTLNSMPGKILVIELLPELLSTD